MKSALLLSGVLFVLVTSNAQLAISPNVNSEFCPNTVVTFTVTFTGTNPSVVPKALNVAPTVVGQAYNIQTSGGVTTFNFDGQFADVNNKQTFQLNYKYGSNNRDTTYDFSFIKIKFLTLLGDGSPNDCAKINPSPANITEPRCQIGSVNIGFANISYINPVEDPKVCYGTVNNYEYLLKWMVNRNRPFHRQQLDGGRQ